MKNHSKTIGKSVLIGLLATVLCIAIGFSIGISSVRIGVDAATASQTSTKFYTDFATFDELEDAASDVAIQIASEGAILLKNRNEALPLGAAEKRVSVFGDHSDNILQAGGGAGGGSSARSKTLKDSMEAAGFTMNPLLAGYYAVNGNPANESDPQGLDSVSASFGSYDGAAVVVISRTGSEMRDITINNKTNGLPGHSHKDDHSLMLEDNERSLIEYIKASGAFDKIVVVLNTPSPMEIAELEDDDDVNSILWIGLTGAEGIMGLGKVLSGEVNPSGRTVDVYASKLDTEPTWFNVSNGAHVGSSTSVLDKTGKDLEKYATLDYEEGIYMGYRFFETAYDLKTAANGPSALEALATTNVAASGPAANVYGKTPIAQADFANYKPHNDRATYDADDVYYNRYNGVLYPFGYGLSYTDFTWTLKSSASAAITDADKNKTLTVEVEVENTGDVAGKDVVQLYSDPQYYTGGIEKATANLVTFAKTRLLQPGEKQTLKLAFTPFELASFDDVDANGNGFAGYELEAGSYKLNIGKDSHVTAATVTYTVAENQTQNVFANAATEGKGKNGIAWDKDPATGNDVDAIYSQNDSLKDSSGVLNNQYANTRRTSAVMASGATALKFTSRANLVGTFPTAPTDADRKFSDDAIAFLDAQTSYNSFMDKTTDKWYKTSVPTDWTQKDVRADGEKAEIQLDDMSGVALGDAKWTDFMNQLTWEEMVGLISSTGFKTPAIAAIGKPESADKDGASQLVQNSDCTYWPNAVVVGATYNVELAELYGIMVGNESLFKNVQGWYAPSMNIHRSPFSGRNFEYYGQDGVHSAILAAAVVKGARSKGVVTYIKHFALNDQEQDRQKNGGAITWCAEQAMREIYLRPFEYAVKKGDANATMGSFNRIGMMPSVNFYDFYVTMTRNEWGMQGYSITDMYMGGSKYWPGNIMARCGTGPLGSYSGSGVIEGTWDAAKKTVMVPVSAEKGAALKESPTQYWAVRDTAMRLLYVAANSNLMANGNKVPLTEAFAEGTQAAVAGGFGTSGKEEIRKTLDGFKIGTKMTDIDIALIDEQLATLAEGTSVSYSLSAGTLPSGLKFAVSTDRNTGVVSAKISGTPTEAGEFNVTFTATVDTYLKVDKLVKFVVEGEPAAEDPTAGEIKDLNDKVGALQDKITELEGKISDLSENTDETSGGCGSSIAAFGVSAAVLAAFAVGALIFALKKKHTDDRN